MSDGANLGITAGRALGTILGDDPQPSDDGRATPEEVRARLEAAPLFEGPAPWEGVEPGGDDPEGRDEAYSAACDSIGHAFLILIEEDPSLLEPHPYPKTYPDGSPMPDWTKGKNRDQDSVVWDAMKERWPHANGWLGGASGFQVGFALNAALYASGHKPVPNPAIVEVEVPNG
jgi:hypothetical protein